MFSLVLIFYNKFDDVLKSILFEFVKNIYIKLNLILWLTKTRAFRKEK